MLRGEPAVSGAVRCNGLGHGATLRNMEFNRATAAESSTAKIRQALARKSDGWSWDWAACLMQAPTISSEWEAPELSSSRSRSSLSVKAEISPMLQAYTKEWTRGGLGGRYWRVTPSSTCPAINTSKRDVSNRANWGLSRITSSSVAASSPRANTGLAESRGSVVTLPTTP